MLVKRLLSTCLGGNQLEQVREHFYPLESVLAYRWPNAAGTACGA
jgi:hypothetical protein